MTLNRTRLSTKSQECRELATLCQVRRREANLAHQQADAKIASVVAKSNAKIALVVANGNAHKEFHAATIQAERAYQ